MFRVTTPQPGYTGVSVGVQFVDGVGECADGPALRYFRSQGYGVEPVAESADIEPPADIEPAEPETPVGPEVPAPPARNASAEVWRAYAVEHGGLTADEAGELSRDQLVELLTTKEIQS